MPCSGILIADDHPLFREALRLAVAQVFPAHDIHEASCVATLFASLEKHRDLELLLLDLNMPGAHGFSALVQARAHYPSVPVVVISARDDAQIIERTLAHGAAGFVPKSLPVQAILQALKAVQSGELWVPPEAAGVTRTSGLDSLEVDAASRLASLTPQQFRVLGMVAAGLLNKQIGAELGISEATVKAHMTAVLHKLGVTNRTQAVLVAQRLLLDENGRSPQAPGG